MENITQFFGSNKYVLFVIILYYLFFSENPKEKKQKIVISYLIIAFLKLFNIFDLKISIVLFLIFSFVYIEFLDDDVMKNKIMNNYVYRLIDYIYILIFQFDFIKFLLSLFCISNYCKYIVHNFLSLLYLNFGIFNYYNIILYIIGFLILLQTLISISSKEFEIHDFTKMFDILNNNVDFSKFRELSHSKVFILIHFEDKSFFSRGNNYTWLCFDFIKYKVKNIFFIVNCNKKRHYKNKKIFRKILNYIKDNICNYRQYIRGYSTIEMQLMRTIGVKNGYQKIMYRKPFEFIYTQLFFKGLKKYLQSNYETVSTGYYRNYILLEYVKLAKMNFGRNMITIEGLFNKKIEEINDSEFFLGVLCLSGKFRFQILNYECINPVYLKTFQLEEKELRNAINKLIKKSENSYETLMIDEF